MVLEGQALPDFVACEPTGQTAELMAAVTPELSLGFSSLPSH